MTKKRKPQLHHYCTIRRIKLITHGTLAEGGFVESHQETREEPCGTPLFLDDEKRRGVCRSCRKGWETEGNTFASEDERRLATEEVP